MLSDGLLAVGDSKNNILVWNTSLASGSGPIKSFPALGSSDNEVSALVQLNDGTQVLIAVEVSSG